MRNNLNKLQSIIFGRFLKIYRVTDNGLSWKSHNRTISRLPHLTAPSSVTEGIGFQWRCVRDVWMTLPVFLIADLNRCKFHNLPRTSGAGRDGAPSPSPLRFQPRWSPCGSSRVAWRALASPSRSLYCHRRERTITPRLDLACFYIMLCALWCVHYLLQRSWRVQTILLHIINSVWSIIQDSVMSYMVQKCRITTAHFNYLLTTWPRSLSMLCQRASLCPEETQEDKH